MDGDHDAHAVGGQPGQQPEVGAHTVGAFEAEDHAEHPVGRRRSHLAGSADQAGSSGGGLVPDGRQLVLHSLERRTQVPTGDQRIADGFGDDGVDASGVGIAERHIRWVSSNDGAKDAGWQARQIGRGMGVGVDDEGGAHRVQTSCTRP